MSTIVTRAGKGSALTWTEGDSNFTNLNTDKLENIVSDTTPQLGGDLDVQANKIVSSVTNGDIVLDPAGTGGVKIISTAAGNGGTGPSALFITDGGGTPNNIEFSASDQTQIFSGSGFISGANLTLSAGGYVRLSGASNAVQIGDGSGLGTLTSSGAYNLIINTNSGTNSGQILLNAGVGGNIEITPNTTGDVYLNADTVRVGDSGAAATITTNGAGNLVLNTNAGTNAGSITLAQGANGSITLAPNGTGSVVLTGPSIATITAPSANVAALQIRNAVTSSATDTYPSVMIIKHRTDIALASMTDEPAVINFTVRDNTSTNRQFGRLIGRYQGSTNPVFTLRASPDGFTTNLHYFSFGGGVGTFGNTSSAYTITSNTGGSLTLTANNNTTSGTIAIASGANADVSITPNGTGKTVITNAVAYEYVYTAGATTGTITPNAALGTIQSITLTGSITFNAFATPLAGQTITMIIKQPAAGGPYTLTSTMLFAGASKTLSTAANAVDILSVTYDGTNYWASLSKGYA